MNESLDIETRLTILNIIVFLSIMVGLIRHAIFNYRLKSVADTNYSARVSVGISVGRCNDSLEKVWAAVNHQATLVAKTIEVLSQTDKLIQKDLEDLRSDFQNKLSLLNGLVKSIRVNLSRDETFVFKDVAQPSAEELVKLEKQKGDDAVAISDQIKAMNALAAFVHMAIMQKRACPCYGRSCAKCAEIGKAMQLLPDNYFKEHYHE